MKIQSHIPNAITLLNLFVGVVGIISVLEDKILWGAYFVILAAFIDFFDGFTARILLVQSELGKQLDSLADVVSFGVLPGIILFSMSRESTSSDLIPYLTLIVPLFSAYRLAKFNLDTRQYDHFIGLPTPANALFISTLPHLILSFPTLGIWIQKPIILVLIAWILAILLVAEIPLIALKFQNFSFLNNIFRYLVLGAALILFFWLGIAGIPFVIILYIILSIIENSRK